MIDCYKCKYRRFLSTPSMRRVTIAGYSYAAGIFISIHTLHAEGDVISGVHKSPISRISIHTLHAEGDGKYDEKIAMVF